MMDVMFKVAAVGVAAALCAGVVRRGAAEFAVLLTLCAGCWMVFAVLDAVGAVAALMDELSTLAGLEPEIVAPVAKTVALALLTRLTGEVCRCAGEGGIAAFVETAGTALALAAALPLVRAVLTLMGELLK